MPVYEYHCPKCLVLVDALRPMGERNLPLAHVCGTTMERKVTTPFKAVFTVTSTDKVRDTLNEEHKRPVIDGGPVRSQRSRKALVDGLNYTVPLEEKVFTGFGGGDFPSPNH